ncbi:single-stranded DNA-binding protein [Romboutsia sp. 1001713B170207_170306_H8]|uniref:single-stranded DNA-binding protein n=1 Tax=Romboutsia sp. 1001713B170207_170306_H8 TaxID=2787112 RepID=UPI00189AF047|nr:single-stranded DNA-binding protein [Romboutsia sp. 1001713B170207_170306_H8]
MNNVVLVGRLTKDPELRYIPGTGTAVARFSIAIDRDYKKNDGTKETDFIPVEIMGKPAEYCANYIPKGRLVAIQGEIRVDRYTDQNTNEAKTFTKVFANKIKSLESSKDKGEQTKQFEPSFEPSGLDPQGFTAIDDDDIPF